MSNAEQFLKVRTQRCPGGMGMAAWRGRSLAAVGRGAGRDASVPPRGSGWTVLVILGLWCEPEVAVTIRTIGCTGTGKGFRTETNTAPRRGGRAAPGLTRTASGGWRVSGNHGWATSLLQQFPGLLPLLGTSQGKLGIRGIPGCPAPGPLMSAPPQGLLEALYFPLVPKWLP